MILSTLRHNFRGLSTYTALHLVHSALLPKMLWASPVWWTGSQYILYHLEPIYHRALRWASGLPAYVTTRKLLRLTCMPPLGCMLNLLSARYAIRLLFASDTHPLRQYLDLPSRILQQPWLDSKSSDNRHPVPFPQPPTGPNFKVPESRRGTRGHQHSWSKTHTCHGTIRHGRSLGHVTWARVAVRGWVCARSRFSLLVSFSGCPFVCLSVVCLSACLFVCFGAFCLSLSPFIRLSGCPFVWLSVCLVVRLSVCPLVCCLSALVLSACLPVFARGAIARVVPSLGLCPRWRPRCLISPFLVLAPAPFVE